MAKSISQKRENYNIPINVDTIKEGKRQNQIEIIKKMLKKNMDLEEIADITGLNLGEIKQIRDL